MSNSTGILQGVRVLDLGRIIAGPFCGQILGDLGAEVIKVEHPDGDDTRHWKPPAVGGEAAYFFAMNRNKSSICLDLSKPEGLQILKDLAAQSDVLIENFRPGVTKRLGIDYAALSGGDGPREFADPLWWRGRGLPDRALGDDLDPRRLDGAATD